MSTFKVLPLGLIGFAMFSAIGCAAPVDSTEADAMMAAEEEQVGSVRLAETGIEVGVIPGDGMECKDFPGSNHTITIRLENEHHKNNNYQNTWNGRFSQGSTSTDLVFCSVSSDGFRHPKGDASDSYAVLKLGDECPNGSWTVIRYFDGEDDPCDNDGPLGLGIINHPDTCGTQAIWGDAAPTKQNGTNVSLYMCVFEGRQNNSSDDYFPSLGNHEWGVIGGGGDESKKRVGYVRTDDEDDDNNNSVTNKGNLDLSAIMDTSGGNTKLFTRRVNSVD